MMGVETWAGEAWRGKGTHPIMSTMHSTPPKSWSRVLSLHTTDTRTEASQSPFLRTLQPNRQLVPFWQQARHKGEAASRAQGGRPAAHLWTIRGMRSFPEALSMIGSKASCNPQFVQHTIYHTQYTMQNARYKMSDN